MNVYVHKITADVLRFIKTSRTRCMSLSPLRGSLSNTNAYFEAFDVVCEKTRARMASEGCFGVRHVGLQMGTVRYAGLLNMRCEP